MTNTSSRTTKPSPGRKSFFRAAAMEKPSSTSLGVELMARPLSFRLILLIFGVMAIVAITYLSNVNFSSTQTIQGNTVHAHDGSIHFVAMVLPATALSLRLDDHATVQFDAFPSDAFGAIGATIISIDSIDSIHTDLPDVPAVRIVLQLDQESLEARDRRIALQAGLSGHAKLVVETKSLLTLSIHYLWPEEET